MGDAPEARQPVKVGVLLTQPPDDLGGWLADAAAFDAAGADALWLDPPADAQLDPLAVTAALASLTFRSLLVTSVPEYAGAPRTRARTLTTIARLSRGRLGLCGDHGQLREITEADGRPAGLQVFTRLGGAFVRARAGGEPERWEPTASPESRAAWRSAVEAAAERGIGGLLVPTGPRLLDILRNPDGLGDRHDLQLAQG